MSNNTHISLNVYFVGKEKYKLIRIPQQTNAKFLNLMPIDIRHEKLIFQSYTNKTLILFCSTNQQEQDWFWIPYSFQFQLNLIIPIMQPFQIFIIWMELLYWIFLFDVFHSNGQLNFFWRFFSIIYIPTILHTCFNEHSFIYVNWIESWIVFPCSKIHGNEICFEKCNFEKLK